MGSDPVAPNAQESLSGSMQAYIQNLPQFLQTTTGQIGPTEQALLDAAKRFSGPTNQLSLDQLKQFLPQFAEVGNSLLRNQAQSGANTAADLLGGAGRRIADSEMAIDKSINPEFYSTRSAAAGKLGELLNSINLGGLSGGERSEVERSLNQDNQRTGNTTPSSLTTVSNAMNYGNALQGKRDALSNAINTATGFLPQSKVGFNPISDTLNSGVANAAGNPGIAAFSPQSPSSFGSNTFGLGQSVFGAATGFQQQANDINANRRDTLDRVSQVWGDVNGTISSL